MTITINNNQVKIPDYWIRLLIPFMGKEKTRSSARSTMPLLTPMLVLTRNGEEKVAIRLNCLEVLVIDTKKQTGDVGFLNTLKYIYPECGTKYLSLSDFACLKELASTYTVNGDDTVYVVFKYKVMTLETAVQSSTDPLTALAMTLLFL